jgi:excisionase family DNA binding protein
MTKSLITSQKHCSSKHAAAVLGVTTRTIQIWSESGVLRPWKTPGGHRRFNSREIEGLKADLKKDVRDAESDNLIRILVIEDDPDLSKLYKMTIESWDSPCSLKLAIDGFQGLIKIGVWKPDIMIVDLQMPGMSGVEMLGSISETALFKKMTTIVVTGLSEAEVAQQGGLPKGVVHFIKPIPFGEIQKIVDHQHEKKLLGDYDE